MHMVADSSVCENNRRIQIKVTKLHQIELLFNEIAMSNSITRFSSTPAVKF